MAAGWSWSHAFCYSLQHWRKPNIWLTCWVSWKTFAGASDNVWPLSFATERVRGRIWGLCAVVMASFSLPWGGCSTILLARLDSLAGPLQLIPITTSLRRSRAQRGTAACCKKTDLLSTTWSLSHHSMEESYWSMHMAIVSNLRLIFMKACMKGLVIWCPGSGVFCRRRTPSSVGFSENDSNPNFWLIINRFWACSAVTLEKYQKSFQ